MARLTVGKGEKRIPIRSITAVQWKPAGMVRGFIQFTVPGGNETRSKFGQQTTDAAKDENSVVFAKGDMPAFQAIREAIEAAIAGAYAAPAQPAYAPPVAASGPPAGWVVDQVDPSLLRWWDGQQLTEHTKPIGS